MALLRPACIEPHCHYVDIASVDEVPPGARLLLTVDEWDVVAINIDGQIFVLEDRCTHEDLPLGEGELEDYILTCPYHGARFDVRTGAVVSPPATEPLLTFPVRVRDGRIAIGLPAG
ncbi:MAG: non-heme iron oxygenase ferredoxin subunit [Chloroflexi bacterium]|nr:non-heme iron oxygenase ferredoxin subunit [Chloroflexota bacterium]